MSISEGLIAAIWIAFFAYWIINSRSVKANAERQDWLVGLSHRIPTLAGSALIFVPKGFVSRLPYPLGAQLIPNRTTIACIGVVLCGLGLALAIWARNIIARDWSSEITLKHGHELVERGPYRFVHPIYTGILLMGLGTAIGLGRFGCWVGFLLFVLGFWIKLRQEESLLIRHFPSTYPQYMRRAKALIPFVF